MDKTILHRISGAISRKPLDIGAMRDMNVVCNDMLRGGEMEALPWAMNLSEHCEKAIVAVADSDIEKANKMAQLHGDILLTLAPHNLDSFLRRLEINRPLREQFYMPRRATLLPLVNALQDLADDKLDELFLSLPARVGKSLANDTPVLTKDGWKKHGDLTVGDEVIGLDGKFKKVLDVKPKCQLDVLMEFGNGEKIQCHENHEWLLYDRNSHTTRLAETKYFESRALETVDSEKGTHRYVFQLPRHEYVVGEEKNLPLDPYTFGVWLGDGANREPRICNPVGDVDIIKRIAEAGIQPTSMHIHTGTGCMYFSYNIRKQLQSMDMCYSGRDSEKHIPDAYLTASIPQRLQLLAGLLDTDGSFASKGNRYQYSTTCEKLRDGFVQLISTFGWRASVSAYAPKTSSSGVHGRKTLYLIGFNPDCEIPCALERKQNKGFSKRRATPLVRISRVEPQEGNSITVEGGMYLAGHSMIPTHNTSMLMFYVLWLIGRDTEKSNLYSAYSSVITTAFYNGCIEIIGDPVTYTFGEIFPGVQVSRTNANDSTLNLGRRKRYPSLTCRSLYGTLNGACDCSGILMSDDLIGGIEEALNKDRLISAWTKVDNNLIPRAKENAKILWCGTRWSMADPAGIRMDLLLNDERYHGRRYRIINTPALNEKDESNFNYKYGVGFSTEYYKQRRASFERNNDTASWQAQYMGDPVERTGSLFEAGDMNFFNGVLPDDEHLVRVVMAVDPAFGGGDFTASPVCYVYDDGCVYVADVVYSSADKRVTQPLIVQKAIAHKVTSMQIEATKTTMSFKEELEKRMQENNCKIRITTKAAPNNTSKEARIFDRAPEIRDMYFLEEGKRSREYSLFMQNVYAFKMTGKNKHDDAVDSLAQAVDAIRGSSAARVSVFNRPF